MKAADYGKSTRSTAAFVATNSICQGRQVGTLWPIIFESGHEIMFAHTSFKWANLASKNAGVTVVIVGISRQPNKEKLIFTSTGAEEETVKKAANINAYLVPGANVIVKQSSTPITGQNEMHFGNMPNDGGLLLLDKEEAELAISASIDLYN